VDSCEKRWKRQKSDDVKLSDKSNKHAKAYARSSKVIPDIHRASHLVTVQHKKHQQATF